MFRVQIETSNLTTEKKERQPGVYGVSGKHPHSFLCKQKACGPGVSRGDLYCCSSPPCIIRPAEETVALELSGPTSSRLGDYLVCVGAPPHLRKRHSRDPGLSSRSQNGTLP